MTTLKFEQRVDKKFLEYILNHPEKYDLQSIYTNGHKIHDKDGVYTQYNDFLSSLDISGRITVPYKQHNARGRYWPTKMGLTNLCKKIRHSIGHKYHIDIDLVNCHPVLLEHYCIKYDIPCEVLSDYNSRRDALKEEYAQNGVDIKLIFLTIMNGGKPQVLDSYISRIVKECKTIQDRICELEPVLYEHVKENRSYNIKGSVLNHVLLDMENDCLMAMVKSLKRMKINITSLAFDGLTIERTKENLENLPTILKKLEASIKRNLKYKVKIVEKPMNLGYEIPAELQSRGKSPRHLISKKPKSKVKCGCETPHSKVLEVIMFLTKELGLTEFDDNFRTISSFIMNVMAKPCSGRFIRQVAERLDVGSDPDDGLDEFIEHFEVDDEFNWVWALTFTNSRVKTHKPLIRTIKQGIKLQNKEPEIPEAQDADFRHEDDVYDYILRYRSTIFESEHAFIQDVVENLGRYVKPVLLPRCFIVNKGNGDIEIMPRIDIITIFTWVDDDGQPHESQVNVLDYLERHLKIYSKIHLYKSITFQPNLDILKRGDMNMYTGLKSKYVDEVDMNLIHPILNHIRTCWANDNDDLYDYIIHWFRHSFTTPWEKTGIVLLLHGEQGTGKGILIDNLLIPFIYGSTNGTVSQGLTPVVQRFNSICMNRLFICCNEVSSEGVFHHSFEKLKALITDNTLSIEKKSIDIFQNYPNYINFIFTTNNSDGVKLGRTDRRYCCIDTSPRYRGNYDYFDMLLSSCNQESADHFYTYCARYEKTRNIRNIPTTSLKEDMMLNATSNVEKFVNDIKPYLRNQYEHTLSRTSATDIYGNWDGVLANATRPTGRGFSISARDMYAVYKLWIEENGERRKTQTAFGRECKHHLPHTRNSKGVYYMIEFE